MKKELYVDIDRKRLIVSLIAALGIALGIIAGLYILHIKSELSSVRNDLKIEEHQCEGYKKVFMNVEMIANSQGYKWDSYLQQFVPGQ